MSRRCLICANINPCRCHSHAAQEAEFDRNCREIRKLQSMTPPPHLTDLENEDG